MTSPADLSDPEAALQQFMLKYGSGSPSKPKEKSVNESIKSDAKYIAINKKLEENLASLSNKLNPVRNDEIIAASPLSEINGAGKFRFKTAKASSLIDGSNSLPVRTPIASPIRPEIPKSVPTRISSPLRVEPKFENKFKKDVIKSPEFVARPSKFFQAESPKGLTKIEQKPIPTSSKNETKSPQCSSTTSPTANSFPSSPYDFTIKMDSSIKSAIDQVFNSSAFLTKNNLSAIDLQENIIYLKEEKPNLLEEYFKVMNQIPIKFFEDIPGFDKVLFLRLKSVVQNVQAKITQNERKLKSMCETKMEAPKRISRAAPISLEELEKFQEDEDEMLGISARDYMEAGSSTFQKPSSTSSTAKPNCTVTSGALSVINGLEDDDDEFDELVNDSNSVFKFKPTRKLPSPSFFKQPFGNSSNYIDDDDYDVQEIIDNVEEAKRIDLGKPKKSSIIDLDTPNNSRFMVFCI